MRISKQIITSIIMFILTKVKNFFYNTQFKKKTCHKSKRNRNNKINRNYYFHTVKYGRFYQIFQTNIPVNYVSNSCDCTNYLKCKTSFHTDNTNKLDQNEFSYVRLNLMIDEISFHIENIHVQVQNETSCDDSTVLLF